MAPAHESDDLTSTPEPSSAQPSATVGQPAPATGTAFTERLKGLSPADRASAIARRDLAHFEVARRRYKRQAERFGQRVMIGSYGVFAIVAWIAYWYMEPGLGAEFATSVVALASVFAAVGGNRLGNRAQVWYLSRRASEES